MAVSNALLYNFVSAYEKLPFECPNKVPKDAPQPRTKQPRKNNFNEEEVGISANLNASAIYYSSWYAQFQAAIALVPCDEEPVSVFIPWSLINAGSNPHDNFSVAVIYTDKSSTTNIKHWLKWVDHIKYHIFYLV